MNNFIQPFGYAELFELADVNQFKYGRFVGFDNEYPEKISWANNYNKLIGVTSANYAYLSGNYNEWPEKYKRNEYGDAYLNKETIAKGKLEYDDIYEFQYIKTYPDEVYSPVLNDNYKDNLNYVKRDIRKEWIPVSLIGRCIVDDNGECVPGKHCKLYTGDDKSLYGTVVPADEIGNWFVLKRISEKTIMILLQ